jgi:hypothetical protein
LKLTLDIDLEGVIIGVSCHFKNYRLAWEIERKLNFPFKRTEDHVIATTVKSQETIEFMFPVYEFYDDVNYIKYRLINNHTSLVHPNMELHYTLVPEYKELDYILVIDGYLDDERKEHLIKKLKEIKVILAVVELDVTKIKRKQDLIF